MPDLPPVFDQEIPLPGGRGIPLWALGAGAIAAAGFFAVNRLRRGAGGGPGQKKVNVTGLQTNQFFQALTQQATRTQELFTQQTQRFQQQFQQQQALTQGQITTLQTQLTGQLNTLQGQMQTGLASVSTQIQAQRADTARLQNQVNQLAAHETRVNAAQAQVFKQAFTEVGAPIQQIQIRQGISNPIDIGPGPTGLMIVDQATGQIRWKDTGDFGTKIQ